MKRIGRMWNTHLKDKEFVMSFLAGIAILLISLVINFYSSTYATKSASNPVTDIILSNIPVFDVDHFFIYGPWILWIFVGLICTTKPFRIPFILKSIALFVIIRSIFISLTHIGPFPSQILIEPSRLINDFSTGGDLFFSAHTGLPFLMALIFWQKKYLRYLFILTSIFFGAIVLLGHLHYSIDVLAAFFITYSIYHIAEVFFKKDFVNMQKEMAME